MTIAFEAPGVVLHHGDCMDVMRGIPDASIDACVTDPPYDLTAGKKGGTGAASVNLDSPYGRSRISTGNGAGGFMGQSWDSTGIAFDPATWAEVLRVLKPGGHVLAFGASRTWHRLAGAIEDAGFEIRDSIAWLYGQGFPKSMNLDGEWGGWGTALKPAFEPIVVGRKPLAGTVAKNVLEHGTGALNIDATRTPTSDALGGGAATGGGLLTKSNGWSRPWMQDEQAIAAHADRVTANVEKAESLGRWPTNVVLDQSQAEALDRQTGLKLPREGGPRPVIKRASGADAGGNRSAALGAESRPSGAEVGVDRGDGGGASRFFPTFHYEAKAPQAERPDVDGVMHPTVKPLDLMRWLVRLVTPKGGTILEPFAGSGTTLEAAALEGFGVIGIELTVEYLPLIEKRLTKPLQPAMFGDWDEDAA